MNASMRRRLNRVQEVAFPPPEPSPAPVARMIVHTFAADPGFVYLRPAGTDGDEERITIDEYHARRAAEPAPRGRRGHVSEVCLHVVNGPAPNGYVLEGDRSTPAAEMIERGTATRVTPDYPGSMRSPFRPAEGEDEL